MQSYVHIKGRNFKQKVLWLKSWISIELYVMFSAVLLSVSLEKTQLLLSMNLLSNQKRDENTVKHCPNLFHWVSSCVYMTYIQQFGF